jgi:hypothetical protein
LKLVVLGAGLGIVIGVNQSSVAALQETQRATTAEIRELRQDVRERLVTRQEFDLLVKQVQGVVRRVEISEEGR